MNPKRRLLALAVVATALVAGAWIGWMVRGTRAGPEIELGPVRFQIAAPPGAQFLTSAVSGGSAIAPDGRSVAFVAVTNGLPRLWVRPLDSLTARELQDTDGAGLPFWSPDSRSIGFFADGNLKRIDVQGGASVVLSRALDPRGGTWNTDGTIVFSPSPAEPLFRVSALGGAATPFTTLLTDETSHRWPQFLPDGRSLLYFVQARTNGVNVTSIDRPDEAKRVVDTQSHATFLPAGDDGAGYLLWVARGSVVAQRYDLMSAQLSGVPEAVPGIDGVAVSVGPGRSSVSASGTGSLLYTTGGPRYQLAWFNPDGSARGTVGAIEEYIGLRLSPNDRDALVTISAGETGDLWRVDLTSGARSRVTTEGRGWYGVWSPDGEEVAFTSQVAGPLEVMSARGPGQPRTLLDGAAARRYPVDWSRDGKQLAYTQADPGSAFDLWLLPMAPTADPTAVLNSAYTELHAQFSPDGRWIAFTSNESSRDDVYLLDLPAKRTKKLVSSGGGSYPRWSRDGHTLLYRAADGQLMSVALRFNGSSVEPEPASAIMGLVEPPALLLYPYDVAADGRILALTRPTESADNLLTVVTNLHTALKP